MLQGEWAAASACPHDIEGVREDPGRGCPSGLGAILPWPMWLTMKSAAGLLYQVMSGYEPFCSLQCTRVCALWTEVHN